MFRSAIGAVVLSFVSVVLVSGSATAAQKVKDKDKKTPGAKWDYRVTDENDKEVEKGVFVARGFVIFNKFNKRIGTYEDVSDKQVMVEITEGKLKGKLDLRRESETSGTWKGELERGSGRKYKISVVFEKPK